MNGLNEQSRVRALWIAPSLRQLHENVRATLVDEGVSLVSLSSAREALAALEDPALAVPHCLFVDANVPGIATLLLAVRAQPSLSHLPVVYLSDHVGQSVLDAAHSIGADDLLWTADEAWLRSLCAQLRTYHPEERPEPNGGTVLILHPREERRRLLGRVYRNAGFEVVFGVSTDDVGVDDVQRQQLKLVVCSRKLLPQGIPDIEGLRAGMGAPFIPVILLSEDDKRQGLVRARGVRNLAVMAEDGPVDNILFLTNELLAGDMSGLRRSRRYLLNGLCAFREVSDVRYHYATLYNISRDGLYVRTLMPLERGAEVCLELRPPSEQRVHLRGRVAWQRGFAGAAGVTPPGFGVQLLPENCPPQDLAAYYRSYETLARSHEDLDARGSGLWCPSRVAPLALSQA